MSDAERLTEENKTSDRALLLKRIQADKEVCEIYLQFAATKVIAGFVLLRKDSEW